MFQKICDIDHFLNDYSRLIHSYYPVSSNNHDCVYGYFVSLHGKWATDDSILKETVNVNS